MILNYIKITFEVNGFYINKYEDFNFSLFEVNYIFSSLVNTEILFHNYLFSF